MMSNDCKMFQSISVKYNGLITGLGVFFLFLKHKNKIKYWILKFMEEVWTILNIEGGENSFSIFSLFF